MVNPVSASVSALQAQSLKLYNAANNIANASTEGRVGDENSGYRPVDTVTTSVAGGVQAATRTRDPAQVINYSPSSPYANAKGEVAAPNVNITEELVVTKQAEQAYKAAAATLQIANEIQESLIRAVDEEA